MAEEHDQQPVPGLIDINEFARQLGVGERFVRRVVDERNIEIIKIGRHVRFDPEVVRKWIEERKRPAREKPRR